MSYFLHIPNIVSNEYRLRCILCFPRYSVNRSTSLNAQPGPKLNHQLEKNSFGELQRLDKNFQLFSSQDSEISGQKNVKKFNESGVSGI